MPVAFVSGHLDIRADEFATRYIPALDAALAEGHTFVVGDARGTDTMAQRYLGGKTKHVVVYHMFRNPRNNKQSFATRGGFKSDETRDRAMTLASDYDIAWARTVEEQKALYGVKYRRRKSGTQKNIDRRNELRYKNWRG